MKKKFFLFLGLVVFCFFISCRGTIIEYDVKTDISVEDGEMEMTQNFYGEFIADDTISLDSAFTKEYGIDELKDYFGSYNVNESSGYGETLDLSEVNQQFPIELIRSKDYSMYKVKEGGYYYVFWLRTYSRDREHKELEPSVYFTAYLNGSNDPSSFEGLKLRKSSFSDVKKIDPSIELLTLLSSGIYSYSYLNEKEILEIEYYAEDSVEDLNKLKVKKMRIISRTASPSKYRLIMQKDIP